VGGRTLAPTPVALGATPYVVPAVNRARSAAPNTKITLFVRIRGAQVRAYVARVARRFDRRAVDATMRLRNLRPAIIPERVGRVLDRAAATRAIVARLRANSRAAVGLRVRTVRPAATRASFGPIVVIRRSSKRLYLYQGARLRRTFGVATGAPSYPTPLGRYDVVVKARHPWWYPPDSDWAEGLEPVAPGPGNPLGTRWMGLSAPGVGIHGTPDSASIGYSASHGCIRMLISEAEWLFERIEVGTPVYIVPA
jgi:lipoprotein-anchoring transpeptidase ErfK/SrfK